MERRHHQRSLLFVLRPVHSRKSKSEALLCRIFRAPHELTSRPERGWITENLTVEFRPDAEHLHGRALCKWERHQHDERTATAMQIAHATNRIAKKVDVLAQGGQSGDGRESGRYQSALGLLANEQFVKLLRFLRDRLPAELFFHSLASGFPKLFPQLSILHELVDPRGEIARKSFRVGRLERALFHLL